MKSNWATLYRLMMSGGKYSEKHIEKVQSAFSLADEKGRKELIKKYSGGVKGKSQNKAVESTDVKRAREDDGTFKADDPATPEVNEAFDPPKKRSARKVKVKRSGKKG